MAPISAALNRTTSAPLGSSSSALKFRPSNIFAPSALTSAAPAATAGAFNCPFNETAQESWTALRSSSGSAGSKPQRRRIGRFTGGSADAGGGFATPTIVHFGAVLGLSAILSASFELSFPNQISCRLSSLAPTLVLFLLDLDPFSL